VWLSERFARPARINAIARERARLEAQGAPPLDLTDSNPTRFGLCPEAAGLAVARAAGRAPIYEPDPRGPVRAREALAARFGGSPDDYWLTASTSESYSWLFAILTDPGDTVAAPAPGYPLIEPLARLANLRTVDWRWHYLATDGWVADPLSAAFAAQAGARLFVLVNPGNPTGAYVDRATAMNLAAAVPAALAGRRPGGAPPALIADEVFNPFWLEDQPTSLAGLDQTATFALGGLSKLICAPQLKLGWIRLSGPARALPSLRAALDQVADVFLSVSGPVARALPDLLDLADDAVARTRARLSDNLTTARAVFGAAPYGVRRCGGGWSVIVDLPRDLGDAGGDGDGDGGGRGDGDGDGDGGGHGAAGGCGLGGPDGPEGDDLAVWLLRRAGLAVHPGWFYDIVDRPSVVLSLLARPPEFAEGCRRLLAALEEARR
jgi:aspartate/methionine/tyrosine aminotransferase